MCVSLVVYVSPRYGDRDRSLAVSVSNRSLPQKEVVRKQCLVALRLRLLSVTRSNLKSPEIRRHLDNTSVRVCSELSDNCTCDSRVSSDLFAGLE